jgi:molybdenum cofactor cytidylyltransferase
MSLTELLGLGESELVALVGGGGKSTLLFALGNELAAMGKRVILTTTTKMGRDQADSAATVCWSADVDCAEAALDQQSPVMLVTEGDDHKVTGPPPTAVDRLYEESTADYVIVEADGSRGKPLKAPAAHEPVIPSTATMVVILMGIDAVGQPLGAAVHRVEEAQRFTTLGLDHALTAPDCVQVILHPEGALRNCPPAARVVIAVTKAATATHHEEVSRIRAVVAEQRPLIRTVAITPTDLVTTPKRGGGTLPSGHESQSHPDSTDR